MSYELVTDTEETYGPTINGLKVLKQEFVEVGVEQAPALHHFLYYGYTISVQALTTECEKLAHQVSEPGVKTSLEHIADVASRAKEFIQLCM